MRCDGWPIRQADGMRMARWTVLPALVAPVVLLLGITIAAALQPAPFDPLRDTISASAALDATDRGVMTLALACLGLAHLGTAVGLRVRPAARLMLGAGGVSTVLVAVFPLPSGGGSSPAHTTAAMIAFAALTIWPLGLLPLPASGRLISGPALLVAVSVLAALVCWFAAELLSGGPLVGLSERVAAVAQALYPLLLVLDARLATRRGGR